MNHRVLIACDFGACYHNNQKGSCLLDTVHVVHDGRGLEPEEPAVCGDQRIYKNGNHQGRGSL